MTVITKDFLKEIEANGMYVAFYNYDTFEEVPIEESDAINIGDMGKSIPIGTFLKTPKKKPINLEWCMNKVNKESTFISLTSLMKEAIEMTGISVYPASYGIGMFRMFGIDKEKLKEIEMFLSENDIEYRNEYSNARYVYRFVISKSKDNIDRIKKATTKQ